MTYKKKVQDVCTLKYLSHLGNGFSHFFKIMAEIQVFFMLLLVLTKFIFIISVHLHVQYGTVCQQNIQACE